MAVRNRIIALVNWPILPPVLPRRHRLPPSWVKELTIPITRCLGRREFALTAPLFPADALLTLPCWLAARERMADRPAVLALLLCPSSPPVLPHPRWLPPRLETEPTIPTTLLPGLREFVSPRFQCQVDVLPTLPCWLAARVHMVDRPVVLALPTCPTLPPVLPHPRWLLPSLERELTILTTRLPGLLEFASQRFQCQVDVLPTLRCWHAARERMADRPAVLASPSYPTLPPALLRRRRLPPRLEREPTIPTTRLLGRLANASPRSPCQVDVLPTLPCLHAVRERMVARLATFASPNFPFHLRRHQPSILHLSTILTTRLLGQQANASTHSLCQVDVLPTPPRQHAARPRMLDNREEFAWLRALMNV